MPSKDPQGQLVEDLKDSRISLVQVGTAISIYINERDDLPESARTALCPRVQGQQDFVRLMFQQLNMALGCIALAYLRGEQEQGEDHGSE